MFKILGAKFRTKLYSCISKLHDILTRKHHCPFQIKNMTSYEAINCGLWIVDCGNQMFSSSDSFTCH